MARWLALVWIPVVAYLAICLFLFLRQRQMIYFPERLIEEEMMAEAGQSGFSRWLDKDQQAIGWMLPGGAEGPPLLIFHGNAGHALGRSGMIQRLRSAGIRVPVFVLDYPGFGSRRGTPTQQSLTDAASAALDALPAEPVVLGESLGTGVAAQVGGRFPDRIRGLILLTPFDSLVSAAQHHYPWLPVGLLVVDRFDSVNALHNFRRPVAVIVGGKDGTTPPSGGLRLYDGLKAPKRLWLLPDADHNDPVRDLSDSKWREIWEFVATGGDR